MDMQKEREAFDDWYGVKPKGWFEAVRCNTAWRAWQAAKAQAVLEIQQSKQAEIDDLKAQLKAAHESRIEFVKYCSMIENSDFVLMPKDPS